ncbi:MAG: histidine kinase [Bacteroidota bacterium]
MYENQNIFEKTVRNRYVQHTLFWAASFYILYRLFAISESVEWVDIIYTFLFHFSLVTVVYLNLRLLIPSFLEKRNYLFYFFSLVVLILLGVGIHWVTFNWLDNILFPDYFFIDFYDFSDIVEFVFSFIFISSLLMFSKSWFRQLETDRKINALEKEKLDAEINALKGQVNPHFLFNSLNNLYSLSLDNDNRVPGIILRLSEMMRYLLYDTNVDKVLLEKEIEHLKNFIEMQELRLGDKVDIKFDIGGSPKSIKIAPLLFLPLVENAFKHGEKSSNKGAFVHVKLDIMENEISFQLTNRKGEVDQMFRKKSGGVGLKNLEKRLQLAYPNSFDFKNIDGTDSYTSVLKIKL